MTTRVAIVGASECDLGITGSTVLALQAQAVARALDDAGLRMSDVDGLATNGISRFSSSALADYLGLQPSWAESTYVGGSACESYIGRAVQAIESGQCTTAVVSFANNPRTLRTTTLAGFIEATPESQFETPYGPLYPISYYAMAAQRYLHEYGLDGSAFAEVAIAAREWALLNPAAFRFGAGPLTMDAVMSSDEISSPLRAFDCCLVTDGGGAVVLTSMERARDLRRAPIAVLGYGEATTNTSMTAVRSTVRTGGIESSARAYAMAGLSPADVDVAELYDSFTVTVLLTLEALGFCGFGEASDFVNGGRIRPGGEFPLNTSGGGLSYCHPGQFGILLLVEAVRQLRVESGARQVKGAEVAICHGTGGILSHHSTVLLGVDR